MPRPSDTPAQRHIIATLAALVAASKPFKGEMHQMKKKFRDEMAEATKAGKAGEAEDARKSLLAVVRFERSVDRTAPERLQEKRGKAAKATPVASKPAMTLDGIRFPEGFKRPAGRPSLAAPFGRDAKGHALAPWGAKADGSIKIKPGGRPAKTVTPAKQAKIAHKAAKKAAKAKAKSAITEEPANVLEVLGTPEGKAAVAAAVKEAVADALKSLSASPTLAGMPTPPPQAVPAT